MKELVDELETLLVDVTTSRDLMNIIFEEVADIPVKPSEIIKDSLAEYRAVCTLCRLQTLLRVYDSRVDEETERLAELFENMHEKLHAKK